MAKLRLKPSQRYMVSAPGSLKFFTSAEDAKRYALNYLKWLGKGKGEPRIATVTKVTVTKGGGFGDPMTHVATIKW